MLAKLLVCAKKEALLIARDREGLAILFLMPIVFVFIMSLALHDFFRRDAAPRFELIVLDADGDRIGRDFAAAFQAMPFFRTSYRKTTEWAGTIERLQEEMATKRGAFAVVIAPGTTRRYSQIISAASSGATEGKAQLPSVTIDFFSDPTIRTDQRVLAKVTIERIAAGVELRELIRRFGGIELPVDGDRSGALLSVVDGPERRIGGPQSTPIRATATQQNVPAYVLLAMFMLVVPLSGAIIKERTQGSLTRLRSMPVSPAIILGGKIVPYLGINLLQVVLCLAIGRWVLPIFGAEALQFGRSPLALLLLTLASSIAAIGFALAIAAFAQTPEQATSFGATAVLIFAALGGVMVPTVMMPEAMASIGSWSPIRWGLDGFLELFVRDASLADIAPRIAGLAAFGAACMALAVWRFERTARG